MRQYFACLIGVILCFFIPLSVYADDNHILYYGYFFPSIYVEETTSFSNLAHAYSSATDGTGIIRNDNAGVKSFVDIHTEFFTTNGETSPNTKYILRPDWREKWNQWWTANKQYADAIVAWYLLDEPDANTLFDDYQTAALHIQQTMTQEGLNIPVLMVTTSRTPRLILNPDQYDTTNSYFSTVHQSWMKNGTFNIPRGIGWIGFDQYNCWAECVPGYTKNGTTISYTIPKFQQALLEATKKVNPSAKLIVIPGVLGKRAANDTSYQTLVIDLAQKYFDYCSANVECVAIINFLYSYRPALTADGYRGSRDYPTVLAKQKTLGKLILPHYQSTLIAGDITDVNDTINDQVNIYDYNVLMTNFGAHGTAGWIRSDLIKNGGVDIYDYNVLISNFLK